MGKFLSSAVLAFSLALVLASVASAHVYVSSSPAFAGQHAVVRFGVPHGCDKLDTKSIEIQLPTEIASVRAMPNAFGYPELVRNGETVTSVRWTKPSDDLLDADDASYEFAILTKIPEGLEFSRLYFPTTQTCSSADGATTTTVEWTTIGGGDHTGHNQKAADDHPAPELLVLPSHRPGWNRYEITDHIHDMSVFNDAQIVWWNDAAYSVNADTMALIEAEEGVMALSQIHPGATIWVKY